MRWRPGGAAGWLGLLVAVHVAWGVLRVPGRVWGERLDDIADYRETGAVRYFLGREGENGDRSAAALEWLLRHSPPASVVLWRGESRGEFERASGLLAPRWLVPVTHVPANAREFLGRPIAAGAEGIAVLVGKVESVALEFR
jgi:hypothetical protein